MITKGQALAVLIVVLTCITLANAVLSAYNYYSLKHEVKATHNVSVANCNEIELVKGAVRATITQAQRFVETSKVRNPQEKAASENYYSEVLDRFKARNCKPETHKEKHASDPARKAHTQQ